MKGNIAYDSVKGLINLICWKCEEASKLFPGSINPVLFIRGLSCPYISNNTWISLQPPSCILGGDIGSLKKHFVDQVALDIGPQ